MTVTRRKDSELTHVLMHKIADIRGGVSVNTAELGGDFLPEGSVLSAPVNGVCHVVKTAVVAADVAVTGKVITLKKGHNLVKGDFVLKVEDGVSSEITAIDKSAKDTDSITLAAALGALSLGDVLAGAKEESSTSSALKYTPLAITGTGRPIVPKSNLDVDAWVFAVTKGNKLPACVASKLAGVINY